MATPATVSTSSRSSVRSINWIGLTLLLLALLAAVPLWTGPGLVNTRGGGDSPFLFFRLHQLVANLRAGVFPARWMPDAAYGLGYPFFNFYASLPYYLAAVFNFLGIDLLVSIKIVQTLGFVFAAFAMYGWTRQHFTTRSASWLAAVAYLYAPFHLVNIYVRGDSLSEFYAFIFYPLILWSIDLIFDSPRNFPLLALSYGGLILTHNVSALIFSPFVIIYCVLSIPWRSVRIPTGALRSPRPHRGAAQSASPQGRSTVSALVLGFFLALALSAFFWLPALGEASLVQLDAQTTGYFNYAEHFRSAHLIQNSIGFDYSIAAAPDSNTPFAMGLVQALATLAGLIAMLATWRRATNRLFRVFVLIGLALSTFMITPLSQGIWDHVPLLPLAQFPWRFLSVQAFFAALAIGFLAPGSLLLASRQISLAPLIGISLVASALLTLRPDYLPIRADEITPDRLQLYEAFTGNVGTTIRAEYLPRTMIPRPYTGPQLFDPAAIPKHPIVSRGEAESRLFDWHATFQTWGVDVKSETATLDFPITYWPGWQAQLDGQPGDTRAAPGLGYIQIDVPRGTHRVDFTLANTPLRSTANLISVIALLMVASLLGIQLDRVTHKLDLGLRRPLAAPNVGLVVLIVIGSGALMMWAQRLYAVPQEASDLTMDFVDKPWLHHNPDGVDFGAARLKSYDLEERSGRIVLSSDWELSSQINITGTIALVTPATHLFGGPAPVVEQVVDIGGGTNRVELTPPYQPATGMYYVRLQIDDRVEYLAPIWIVDHESTPASHVFGKLTPAIGLDAVQTQLRDRNQLDVLLQWAVTGVTADNYGISLRLHDSTGKVRAALDTQPGYGFQPTSAWQPGTIADTYSLQLPGDLPLDETYALDVILYHVASQQEVGRTTIDHLAIDQLHTWQPIEPPARTFSAPAMSQSLGAIFGDQIELLGYDLKQKGETLQIDLAWRALRDLDANYKVFAHVFDPATEQIAAQWDAMPRNNAYPTSRWLAQEVVTDTITIPLVGVPAGEYRIALGLYEPAGRLPINGAAGIDAAQRRVILEEKVAR